MLGFVGTLAQRVVVTASEEVNFGNGWTLLWVAGGIQVLVIGGGFERALTARGGDGTKKDDLELGKM